MESNHDLKLRRLSFYPLNYGDVSGLSVAENGQKSTFAPATGMEFFVNFAQLAVSNVGVDLGGGDTGMPQHGLDTANVSSVLEQVGGI